MIRNKKNGKENQPLTMRANSLKQKANELADALIRDKKPINTQDLGRQTLPEQEDTFLKKEIETVESARNISRENPEGEIGK